MTDHIHKDYFLEASLQKDQASRSQFANEWINYATDELGWSDQYVAFLLYRLYTEQYQLEDELSMLGASVHFLSI